MLGVDIAVFHRAIKPLLLDIRLYSSDPFRKDALSDFSVCWFSVERIQEYIA